MKRLLLAVGTAAIAGLFAGLASEEIAAKLFPCLREQIACDLTEAIGLYSVMIWSLLGFIVYAVTMLIERSARGITVATLILLLPLLAYFTVTRVEDWHSFGYDLYRDFRAFIVMLLPPGAAMLAQATLLNIYLQREQQKAHG